MPSMPSRAPAPSSHTSMPRWKNGVVETTRRRDGTRPAGRSSTAMVAPRSEVVDLTSRGASSAVAPSILRRLSKRNAGSRNRPLGLEDDLQGPRVAVEREADLLGSRVAEPEDGAGHDRCRPGRRRSLRRSDLDLAREVGRFDLEDEVPGATARRRRWRREEVALAPKERRAIALDGLLARLQNLGARDGHRFEAGRLAGRRAGDAALDQERHLATGGVEDAQVGEVGPAGSEHLGRQLEPHQLADHRRLDGGLRGK